MKTKRRIVRKTKRRKGGAVPSCETKAPFYFNITMFKHGFHNLANTKSLDITKITHPELFECGTTYQQIVDEIIKINHTPESQHRFASRPHIDESRLELYVYHDNKKNPAFIINFANLGGITDEPIEHRDLLILNIRDEDKISTAIKKKYIPFDEMVHEVTTQTGRGKRKTRRLSSA